MFPDPIFTSFLFLEYNSVTIRNSLMILGRIIEQVNMEYGYKNDTSDYLRNILMIHDRIIEQVNAECRIQE